MSSDGKGQNCEGVVTGFSIMTTFQPIPTELVNISSLFFPTPLTHLTLLHVISFCSPMLKRPLKGRFETIPEIKANATKELKGMETYLDCFRKDKCVRWEGEYFEGDSDL